MLSPATKIDTHRARKNLLRAVASLEFLKGIFVLLIGLCAILLVRKDAWVMAESLLALLHINTDRHVAQLFLNFADNLTDTRLWTAAKLAFVYSALRFTEGYGLWKQRTWAEWIAFGSGTLLLPLEVRGLLRGITVLRSVVFAANLGIVFYMFFLLRAGRRERRQQRLTEAESRDQSGS
ncbi:MAG: uncharacterized protein JWQ87_1243 [Candidatus Sulfotelmatobacter sp.]|nr:uncharacterized protein [Candidatus Sulfotelmatobacter sp.]